MRSVAKEFRLWAWTGGWWRLLLLLGLAQRKNSMWEKIPPSDSASGLDATVSQRTRSRHYTKLCGRRHNVWTTRWFWFVWSNLFNLAAQRKSFLDSWRWINPLPSNKQINKKTFEWLSEGVSAYTISVWRTTAHETARSHTGRCHSRWFRLRTEDPAAEITFSHVRSSQCDTDHFFVNPEMTKKKKI